MVEGRVVTYATAKTSEPTYLLMRLLLGEEEPQIGQMVEPVKANDINAASDPLSSSAIGLGIDALRKTGSRGESFRPALLWQRARF